MWRKFSKRKLARWLLINSRWVAVKWTFLPEGIYCFNFHRVGDASTCQFDRGVYSCGRDTFADVIHQISSHFRVITLTELSEILLKRRQVTERCALITFDDGYRDNFTTAFPILHDRGVHAVFFLTTAFVSAERYPWWDLAAWAIRNARVQSFAPVAESERLDVTDANVELVIRRVLRMMKRTVGMSLNDMVSNLYEQTGADWPSSDLMNGLFMNWDEARHLQQSGMSIGCHTHTHPILSRLSVDEQRQELLISKEILTRELGDPPLALSYPVGGRTAFTESTMRVAREAGFMCAFSFVPGRIDGDETELFSLPRFAVDEVQDWWTVPLRIATSGKLA